MATDTKPPQQVSKYEQFVERQLSRATRRIHTLDLGRSILWLVAVTMTFALAMAGLDLALAGQPAAEAVRWFRVTAWAGYLLVALFFIGLFVVRFFGKINPYYAAKQIEETLPDAKNSVVNWLDLRDEKLPPAIHNALGLRAAQDLKTTDPEQVSAGKHSWLLVIFTLALALGMAVLLIKAGPRQFVSLMQRAFVPIQAAPVVSKTDIVLLQPAKGDIIIPPQQNIVFRAAITGTVPKLNTPEAARLHYRYQDSGSWASLPLVQDLNGDWTATMDADLVQNGFFYKLSAADAETAEHQVQVKSLPQAQRFEVAYHFQPYLRLSDFLVAFPNAHEITPRIKAHRGTDVTLTLYANHPLLEGKVQLDIGKETTLIPGELSAENPNAFRVKFRLEKSGLFRVRFTSRAGEHNSDLSPYPLEVISDLGPHVVLSRPGKDIALPANGTLQLEGSANDDFGIKNLTLKMKIIQGDQQGQDIAAKPYRPGAKFQFADGAYPDYLEYKDFVALAELQSPAGKVLTLAPGTVLAYWLEATDNSEYPSKTGTVGKSEVYRVTIADPADDKAQQQERNQAAQEQKKHEKAQDEDLKQQEQDRNDNRRRTPEERKQERDVRDQAERLQKEIDRQKKENDETNKKDPRDATQKDVDNLKGQAKQPGSTGDNAADKLSDIAEQAQDPQVREGAKQALKEASREPKTAKNLTPKDVEKLEEKLEQQGPAADAAERKLAKAAQEAADPRTREAAEKALAKAGRDQATKDLKPADIEKLAEQMKQRGPDAEAAERKLGQAAEKSQDAKTKEAAQQALKEAIKNLTPKDVDNLKEKLKQKGPSADSAEQKLGKAAEEAQDAKTRAAAEQALKDAIKKLSPKDIDDLNEKLKQRGAKAESAEQKLGKAAEQAHDPKTRAAADQALKDAIKNLTPQDIEDLKEKLKQPGAKAESAEQKLGKAAEQAQDPKSRAEAEKALKEIAKNLSPKDIEELAKKMKQAGPQSQPGQAAEKKLERAADQAEDARTREAAAKALKDAIKNLTAKDIADLKEKLKQQGPGADAAEQKLDKAAKEANDPKARAAAAQALKDAIKDLSPKDIAELNEKLKQSGPSANAAEQKLQKAAEQSQDPQASAAAKDSLKALAEKREKDFEKLSKALQDKGPEGEAARRELAKAAEAMKDPKTRKALEDALKQAGSSAKELSKKDIDTLKELAKQDGPLGAAAKKALSEAADNAKDPSLKNAAGTALKEAEQHKKSGKELTEKEIADLKKQLKEKGPHAEDAARALANAAENAKDPAAKKAAQQALKDEKIDPRSAQAPNRKDVERLKEMLDKKGLAGDMARRELKEISKHAKNPEAKKAAEDALRAAPPNENGERTADDVEFLKSLQKQPGPLGQYARDELGRIAKESKDLDLRKLAKEALREEEERNVKPFDPNAAKRSGDLHLEDLMKNVSPEVLKKLGIGDKEWKQFLKDARRYEESNPQPGGFGKDDAANKKGDPSLLPSTAPQLVNPSVNPALTPTQSGRGQPPPGFREAYQRWTIRQPSASPPAPANNP